MYFKRIEMRGFKSFVDETRMEFEPGITIVVGPNGCGKSNIADGLRWVLGEQSAKLMRGVKMEDFIFNGSSTRKQMGYAEVSITISNAGGIITTQPYAEYEDITVTRKLYRSGESEYYINKIPCRLKDIVDIFLDTGVSTRAFSIIEQGQVTRLVNSKPEERRFIIEEAAGVMKYKHRRNAALNKLEASQQNLLRIQDILGELEKQRNSLNRQAKKAERYKEFRSELRGKGLLWFSGEYQRQAEELRVVTIDLESGREKEANLTAELLTKRNDVEILSAQVTQEERALGELREERNQHSSGIDRNEHHIDLLTRQLEELNTSNDNATAEIAQVEGEIGNVEKTMLERDNEIRELVTLIENEDTLGKELKTQIDGLRGALNVKQTELSKTNRESMQALEQISSIRNKAASVKTKLEMSAGKLDNLNTREQEISAAMASLETRFAELKAESENHKTLTAQERVANTEIRARLTAANESLRTAQSELRGVENEITKLTARLNSLQELDKNLEGFGEGVKRIMKLKSDGAQNLSGVRGLLADGVRVSPELELALTGILGERLEAVIVEDSACSAEAVKALKAGNLGRASFVPADLVADKSPVDAPTDHPAFAGRASEMVTLSDGIPRSVATILADTLIARDLAGALDMWKTRPGVFTIVTMDGDVVDSSGLVTGGSAKKGAGAGIVARKRMIEELGGAVAQLTEKKNEAAARESEMVNAVRTERGKLDASEANIRKMELRAVELSKETQREESEVKRAVSQLESLKRERAATVSERERLASEEASITSGLSELETKKAELDSSGQNLQKEIDDLRRNLDEMSAKARADEVKVTEMRGRLANLRSDVKRLEGAKTEYVNRVARLKNSIRDFGQRKTEMEESVDLMREENVILARKKDGLTSRINELGDALNEKIDKRNELEKSVRELEKSVEEIRGAVAELAVKKSELDMRVENVVEKADHDFNIPIEDLKSCDVSGADMDDVNRRLSFLRGEISRIGDVNMSALEEFEDVNGRFEFLKNQHNDLVTSIATLRKTIESINATTSAMFNETFEVVSKNFDVVFKRLFGGGRTEMKLIQEEGQIEPGLEIYVQPPGKKVQNLNLLSAGEKAMTAISLLFAVFMTKPSPFCLLDEVDAPLDEANINRFRDMLMEMKQNTQFIIITHNQKTMAFGDRLYGVTQEEEGVSKILAVDLSDKRQEELVLNAA